MCFELYKKQLTMKKLFTFFTFFTFFATCIYAGPVDPERALETATAFWNSNVSVKQKATRLVKADDGMAKAAGKRNSGSNAQFYMFEPENGEGFVIVSGEEGLTPVIGYSTGNTDGEMPASLEMWLSDYCAYVNDVRQGKAEPVMTSNNATGKSIAPMLKTTWNQSAPYNNLCPEINGSKTPTGCTATAMAQIMKHHNWPEKPKRAISWTNNITGKTETIDITKNKYDWNNMLNHYRNGYTQVQADAVSRLMVDVGKAIQSNYELSGTGSSSIYAAWALVNVFDYSSDIILARRSEYTYDEYMTFVRDNLEAGLPLLYAGHGQSYSSGHAFVCDGIDENNLLHIDWGWDGAYNGYFDIGSMSPGGSGIGGGEERYNVGQSILANIKPRTAGDTGREGDPSLFTYYVVDPDNNNAEVDTYTSYFKNGKAKLKVVAGFLNWSHSAFDMKFGISIKSEDGTYHMVDMMDELVPLSFDESIGYYIEFYIDNSSPNNEEYLKEGTYYVEMYCQKGNEEPQIIRGEHNCLILEVGKQSATLSKARPQIEVTDFSFRDMPSMIYDNAKFDVAFRNNNTRNATIIIVPVVNRIEGGKTVHSDTLATAGTIVDIHDRTGLITTFDIKDCFYNSGEYTITFTYDFRNFYTNHSTTVDNKKLKGISGSSKTFNIEGEPTGAFPAVTAISSSGTTIGKELKINATVVNKPFAKESYSGVLGLFAEKDGKSHLLLRQSVQNLRKGAEVELNYSSADYYPVLDEGKYRLYIAEVKDNRWSEMSYGTVNMTLTAPSTAALYADGIIDINNGEVVVQGDSIDVKLKVASGAGDIDGFIRMNVINGLTGILRSGYIPVNIKEGESVEVSMRCKCSDKAALGQWKARIVVYDKNKSMQGLLSANDLTYANNGRFWIGDATAIDETEEDAADIVTTEGCITVHAPEEATVAIYTTDGKNIYSGTATSVKAEAGLYIVTVCTREGAIETRKCVVR